MSLPTGHSVPVFSHSDLEEVSPDVQSSVSHSDIDRVCCCPRDSGRLCGHVKPFSWIYIVLAGQYLVGHNHVRLMASLF